MSLEEWQIALRREYGRKQKFVLKNLGREPIFSEFAVTNPESKKTYRVAIRGQKPGDNHCTCPDFTVNTLGTCKHIEFTLAKLENKPGAKKIFKQGYQPAFTEVYMRYGVKREISIRYGAGCQKKLLDYSTKFFDANGVLKPEAVDKFHTFLPKAPLDGHELRCGEEALQFVAYLRDENQRQKRIDELFPKGYTDKAFNRLLTLKLHPYQKKRRSVRCQSGTLLNCG